jgi:hypothetical protein
LKTGKLLKTKVAGFALIARFAVLPYKNTYRARFDSRRPIDVNRAFGLGRPQNRAVASEAAGETSSESQLRSRRGRRAM